MERVVMYPMLTKENKITGLEPPDFLLLVGVYLFVFLFSKTLWVNLIVVLGAYVFLRLFKRKKAPRYTQSLVRFLVKPSRYTQARELDR
ncbi:MAG: hypothetical protein HZC17_00125 [Candidatus Omnitrophica bacterium]|nr:hypothetical protein [Candidatus Omnitrophota bacterium]